MVSVPVSFEHNGKYLHGFLQAVSGGGAGIWHLMIDNFYYGKLRQANGVWVFDGNRKLAGTEQLAGILGAVVGDSKLDRMLDEESFHASRFTLNARAPR